MTGAKNSRQDTAYGCRKRAVYLKKRRRLPRGQASPRAPCATLTLG